MTDSQKSVCFKRGLDQSFAVMKGWKKQSDPRRPGDFLKVSLPSLSVKLTILGCAAGEHPVAPFSAKRFLRAAVWGGVSKAGAEIRWQYPGKRSGKSVDSIY